MKKIYLALLSALLTVGGGVSAQTLQKINKGNLQLSAKVQLAPAADDETVISETPEGTLHGKDFRSGIQFQYSRAYGQVVASEYENAIGQYVEGTDGNLYLRNPSSVWTSGTWIKLEKVSDGRYVAKPQLIYVSSTGTKTYARRLVVKSGSSTRTGITYVTDSINTETGQNTYFTYKDGVLAMEDDETLGNLGGYPATILGLTDENGTWNNYGDACLYIASNNEAQATLPAGVKPELFAFTSSTKQSDGSISENKAIVNVAIDGNNVYINNPATNDSTSWILGTIDGNKVTVKPQYIGADFTDGYHLWALPAVYKDSLDAFYARYGYTNWLRSHEKADELVFNYDAANKTLSSPAGSSLAITAAEDRLYYLAIYDSVQIAKFVETPATPADPTITNFVEYNGNYGYLAFQLPSTDTNGNVMNTNKEYYRMYVDDPSTPYVFYQDTYSSLPVEELTDVPYNYNDQVDLFIPQAGYRVVYYYFDTADLDSIGIQSVYKGGDEEHTSNIVWRHTAHYAAGINGITNNDADVKGVAYYDLSGRRVAAPKQAGIYIKETTLADGTKKSVKVLKK